MKTDELENIVLKPPVYNKLSKSLIPFLAAVVIIGSVFLLFAAPDISAQGFLKNGLTRILISVFIFAASVVPLFKKNYFVITSYKIMQLNKWELNFKDIGAVDIHKRFFKHSIEITPKQNPELKFSINQWDINRKVDEVAKELTARINNFNKVNK